MTEYLRDRNDWDSETFESVSWPAFSAARFAISNSRFAPEFCHCHLPVGEKANRNDAKYFPCCPACPDPCKSNKYFLLCAAPSRLQWHQKLLASLKTELTRLFTSSQMIMVLMETIDRLLNGKIISCTGTFHEIAHSQQSIGWMALFRGYWSRKWLDAHLLHVSEVPLRDPKDQERRQTQQERWRNKVSSFVMRQCHKLWLLRNNERHIVTPGEKATALYITTERALK
jgi:hypothetical protein